MNNESEFTNRENSGMVEERKTPNLTKSLIDALDFSGDIAASNVRQSSLNNSISSILT